MITQLVAVTSALWIAAAALSPTQADDTTADPDRGSALFRSNCFACHSLDADRVGPRLGGVFGRTAGTVPSYAYSPALTGAGFVWDWQSLNLWLAGPREFLPGARMTFSLQNDQDRRDLIAYLAQVTSEAP